MKNVFIFIVIVLVVFAAYWILGKDTIPSDQGAETETKMEDGLDETSVEDGKSKEDFTVIYTDNGYTPKELTVEVGSTVIFKNESSSPSWPASAMHPTHKSYPGSDIKKCGTSEADMIFDACRAIASGESWSFTFDEAGQWSYHDHLNSSKWGKVIVK
jgi:plastocyanin